MYRARGTVSKAHLTDNNKDQFGKYSILFKGTVDGTGYHIEKFMSSFKPIPVFDSAADKPGNPADYDNKVINGTITFTINEKEYEDGSTRRFYNVVGITAEKVESEPDQVVVKNPIFYTEDELDMNFIPEGVNVQQVEEKKTQEPQQQSTPVPAPTPDQVVTETPFDSTPASEPFGTANVPF